MSLPQVARINSPRSTGGVLMVRRGPPTQSEALVESGFLRRLSGLQDANETSTTSQTGARHWAGAGLARAAGRTYPSMPQRCSVVIVRGVAPTGTMKVPTTTASVSGSSFLTSIDASGPISKKVSPTP